LVGTNIIPKIINKEKNLPSNEQPICNVPPPPKLPKICNVPPNDKNTLNLKIKNK
jgi:hypothetical protein